MRRRPERIWQGSEGDVGPNNGPYRCSRVCCWTAMEFSLGEDCGKQT